MKKLLVFTSLALASSAMPQAFITNVPAYGQRWSPWATDCPASHGRSAGQDLLTQQDIQSAFLAVDVFGQSLQVRQIDHGEQGPIPLSHGNWVQWPVHMGYWWRISQAYNQGTHVGPLRWALDFKHPAGDAMTRQLSAHAAGSGYVVRTGFDPSVWGNYVICYHGGGWYTFYCHLKRVFVSGGQWVTHRTLVGQIGESGMVIPNPHLHFEVDYVSNGFLVSKNPEPIEGRYGLYTGYTFWHPVH